MHLDKPLERDHSFHLTIELRCTRWMKVLDFVLERIFTKQRGVNGALSSFDWRSQASKCAS